MGMTMTQKILAAGMPDFRQVLCRAADRGRAGSGAGQRYHQSPVAIQGDG